jgi:hypothetical protein
MSAGGQRGGGAIRGGPGPAGHEVRPKLRPDTSGRNFPASRGLGPDTIRWRYQAKLHVAGLGAQAARTAKSALAPRAAELSQVTAPR